MQGTIIERRKVLAYFLWHHAENTAKADATDGSANANEETHEEPDASGNDAENTAKAGARDILDNEEEKKMKTEAGATDGSANALETPNTTNSFVTLLQEFVILSHFCSQ